MVGATPVPTQDGIAVGCTAFYYVVSSDGCWAIANYHGITLDNLYLWNPAFNGDCSDLFPNYYVGISRTVILTSIAQTSTITSKVIGSITTTSIPKISTLISTINTTV